MKLGSSNPKAGLPMPRVVVSQMLSFLQPGDIARFAAVSKQTHALASAVPGVHSRAVVQNYIDLNANHDKAWRKSNNASFAAHVIGLTVIGLPFSIAMVRHFDRKVSAAQEQLATAWRPEEGTSLMDAVASLVDEPGLLPQHQFKLRVLEQYFADPAKKTFNPDFQVRGSWLRLDRSGKSQVLV